MTRRVSRADDTRSSAEVKPQKFVLYARVRTEEQGRSGLGLEAQRYANGEHVRRNGGVVVGEFVEVETGKGSNALDRRPMLRAALAMCKKAPATLLSAKIDRVGRNMNFVSGLMESGVDFAVADMPNADKVMLHMYAVMAEWERDAISRRTREALAAAKARGIRIGLTGPTNLRRAVEARQAASDAFAARLRGVLEGFLARGLSQRAIVRELNALGVKSPGGGAWHLRPLQRVMARLAAP